MASSAATEGAAKMEISDSLDSFICCRLPAREASTSSGNAAHGLAAAELAADYISMLTKIMGR